MSEGTPRKGWTMMEVAMRRPFDTLPHPRERALFLLTRALTPDPSRAQIVRIPPSPTAFASLEDAFHAEAQTPRILPPRKPPR